MYSKIIWSCYGECLSALHHSPTWIVHFLWIMQLAYYSSSREFQDILAPYQTAHGSRLNHRQVRDCQPIEYGNVTHEMYPANKPNKFATSHVETHTFSIEVTKGRFVKGHVTTVDNPIRQISVLEPLRSGGCKDQLRATVTDTARQNRCRVAVNAGFFNTSTGACIGNVISNGELVRNSRGIQNAHFGITKDGALFFGYLAEEDVYSENTTIFQQLVGGVIWLVRNSSVYVHTSKIAECSSSQDTGNLDMFTDVISARTAIGHDKDGRVILLQVEGKTGKEGANLLELASIMKRFGAVNAINTDGGGSATFVENNTVVNYPSDECSSDPTLKCVRPVSTIICVKEMDCGGVCEPNGICEMDTCKCRHPWMGVNCTELPCHSHHCTGNGICTEYGCVCSSGWSGDACQKNVTFCLLQNSSQSSLLAMSEQSKVWIIVLVVISTISTIACISLICTRSKTLLQSRKRYRHHTVLDIDSNSSSDEEELTALHKMPT